MKTQYVSQQKNQFCQLTIKIVHIVSMLQTKRKKMKYEKQLLYKNKLDEVLENLNVKQKRLNKIVYKEDVSNKLNAAIKKMLFRFEQLAVLGWYQYTILLAIT